MWFCNCDTIAFERKVGGILYHGGVKLLIWTLQKLKFWVGVAHNMGGGRLSLRGAHLSRGGFFYPDPLKNQLYIWLFCTPPGGFLFTWLGNTFEGVWAFLASLSAFFAPPILFSSTLLLVVLFVMQIVHQHVPFFLSPPVRSFFVALCFSPPYLFFAAFLLLYHMCKRVNLVACINSSMVDLGGMLSVNGKGLVICRVTWTELGNSEKVFNRIISAS